MPLDYFSFFSGVLIDLTIIKKLLEKFFPNFVYNITQISSDEYCIRNVLVRLLFSLFSQDVADEVYEVIWDLFFLDGSISFFRAAIIFFLVISESEALTKKFMDFDGVTYNESFGNELSRIFIEECKSFRDVEKMRDYMFNYDFGFSADDVNCWRASSRRKGALKEKNSISSTDSEEPTIMRKNTYIHKEECDLDWPICLYDRKYRFNRVEFIIYKAKEEPEIIENYFSGHRREISKIHTLDEFLEEYEENEDDYNVDALKKEIKLYESLVIERHKHICDCKKSTKEIVFTNRLSFNEKKEQLQQEIKRSQRVVAVIDKFISEKKIKVKNSSKNLKASHLEPDFKDFQPKRINESFSDEIQ